MINPFEILSTKLENIERLLLDIKYKDESLLKKAVEEKLLSPKETTKLFIPQISIATLNNWAKAGLIEKQYIGNLTFYKQSEILASLHTLKKYNRRPTELSSLENNGNG